MNTAAQRGSFDRIYRIRRIAVQEWRRVDGSWQWVDGRWLWHLRFFDLRFTIALDHLGIGSFAGGSRFTATEDCVRRKAQQWRKGGRFSNT